MKMKSNNAREYFAEYCNNTTLHGLKYVGGEKRTIIEKCLWIFLFSFSLATCATMIYKTYIKWENNPVIISLSHEQHLIWKVPFPAVTICPFNKINATKYNNFKDKNKSSDLIYICPKLKKIIEYGIKYIEDDGDEQPVNTTEIKKSVDIEDDGVDDEQPMNITETLIEKLIEFAPSMNVLETCEFNGEHVQCNKMYSPIMTEDGICYSFNMIKYQNLFEENVKIHDYFNNDDVSSNSDWSLEEGFKKADKYPRRSFSRGVKSGLEIILTTDPSEHEPVCSIPVFGFKVFIHPPNEIPTAAVRHITIAPNQDVNVALTPDYYTIAKELIKYPVEKRNCYFDHEKKLKFFKIYSQKNCELECITNITIALCGCVPFYMPRESETRLCLDDDYMCTQIIEKTMSMNAIDSEHEIPCDCQPSCYSLDYKTATSQAPINHTAFLKTLFEAINETYDKPNETTTILRIFQNELLFTSKERRELHSVTDLLSNFGGLLGLFIGFSVLSLLEILYYFSVRSWANKLTVGKYFVPTPDGFNKHD